MEETVDVDLLEGGTAPVLPSSVAFGTPVAGYEDGKLRIHFEDGFGDPIDTMLTKAQLEELLGREIPVTP